MTKKALSHHVLMFVIAVVGEGYDGDAASRVEPPDDLQIFGLQQFDQVFHDDVDTVLVEIAVVAEAEEIEFETLAFHHECARNVVDDKMSEIGLARPRAQRGKFRTIQSHKVLVLRMFVFKHLQHLGGIVVVVLGVLVAQQRQTF